jgi:fumarate hydratase class II
MTTKPTNTMAYRIVHDSMGEVKVPEKALYGAQTQRAIDNFPISFKPLPKGFIQALGLIKLNAAKANLALNLLDEKLAKSMIQASTEVANNLHDEHFPIDVFQTGSATSSNMNANEVIAQLASLQSKLEIHPNDHVNMGQSSNDVIPTAIHLSASLALSKKLLPALQHLQNIILKRAEEFKKITKTGRTHLMDAMPVTLGQELSGWAQQINHNHARLNSALRRLTKLAIGGTAVGTGINAHPKFAQTFAEQLSDYTQIKFSIADNYFEALSCQDTAVELSGQLKTTAVSLMKIANDLRWMNSGPLAGIAEIALPSLQPGSSIMPGKVNPVIPEAVTMVCAQVIGNDTCITLAGQSGNFQLNVMLPVIARNLLESIEILGNATILLADKAILGFTVNQDHIQENLAKNPILITALNREIGYELGAKIAKAAYQQKRSLIDVALEMTNLSEAELKRLLDPYLLTQGGIVE